MTIRSPKIVTAVLFVGCLAATSVAGFVAAEPAAAYPSAYCGHGTDGKTVFRAHFPYQSRHLHLYQHKTVTGPDHWDFRFCKD